MVPVEQSRSSCEDAVDKSLRFVRAFKLEDQRLKFLSMGHDDIVVVTPCLLVRERELFSVVEIPPRKS